MDSHPRKLRIYKNGDSYFTGKKILLHTNHRNLEQVIDINKFLAELSRDQIVIGGVRRLYTITGKRIKSLDDIEDNAKLVATNGDVFRNVDYNEEEAPVFNGYSKTNLTILHDLPPLQKRKINRSTGGLLLDGTMETRKSETNLNPFALNDRGFKVAVFENGEPNNEPFKLVLNHRNCKSFEQLLKYFSSLKLIKSGQVRKIFDVKTGKRLRTLQDLENGQNLVLSAFDPLKKVGYRTIDLMQPHSIVKKEPEQLRIVRFYPNGDAYHTGLTLTMSSRRFPTLLKLLDHLNTQIELVTGRIQKIYTLDGIRMLSIEDMKQTEYVLVANDDPFIKSRYNVMATRSSSTSSLGLNGATLHNEFINMIRPITTKRKSRKARVVEEVERVQTSHSRKEEVKEHVIVEKVERAERVVEKEVIKPARVVPRAVEKVERVVEKEVEKPVAKVLKEEPVKKQVEKPAEKPVEKQDKPVEKPVEKQREKSAKAVQKSVQSDDESEEEKPTKKLIEKQEKQREKSAKPVQKSVQSDDESEEEKPTKKPIEKQEKQREKSAKPVQKSVQSDDESEEEKPVKTREKSKSNQKAESDNESEKEALKSPQKSLQKLPQEPLSRAKSAKKSEKDLKFVDDVKSKPSTAKNNKSRASTPGIPEDDSIKNQTGREEESFEQEVVSVLESVKSKRGESAKQSKSTQNLKKSSSRIPKLVSRTSSLEQVQKTKSEQELQVASEAQ